MDSVNRVLLVDINIMVVEAWRDAFAGVAGVEVIHGRFEDLSEYDCMVSAANSFGIMDGGVDLAISRYFGWDLMDRVQAHILEHYFGEQPVGTAFVVGTGHDEHPYLAHAPTMRVPRDIRGTDNAYLATLAVFRAVRVHNTAENGRPIRVLAFPGMGTATGRLSPRVAAAQMALAYRVASERTPTINWMVAKNRHRAVVATNAGAEDAGEFGAEEDREP